jgi:hypothetical protein
MAESADVRAIDALREWVSSLAIFKHEAEEALAGIALEIRRGLDWVAQQQDLWQRAVREREEAVVQAKAELAARRFPNWDGRMPDTTVQERNLRRAEARLEHAQDQVVRCRKWIIGLPRMIEETYGAAGHRLQMTIEGEVARGVADLQRRIEALERYAETRADFAPSPSAALLPTTEPPKG